LGRSAGSALGLRAVVQHVGQVVAEDAAPGVGKAEGMARGYLVRDHVGKSRKAAPAIGLGRVEIPEAGLPGARLQPLHHLGRQLAQVLAQCIGLGWHYFAAYEL